MGLQLLGLQPRCGLCPRFHGFASSRRGAQSLPCVILLNWVGPLPPGQSSRSRLGSRTTRKGLGRKVQLCLQQEQWITSPCWHHAPLTEGQTAFGAWPLQLGHVSVWDEIYLTLAIKKMDIAWAWAVYFVQWRRVGLLHPRCFILVQRCDNLPSTLDHLHPDNVIPACSDQVPQFWRVSAEDERNPVRKLQIFWQQPAPMPRSLFLHGLGCPVMVFLCLCDSTGRGVWRQQIPNKM